MKNLWVFDGPDWVAFLDDIFVKDRIVRSLGITFPGGTIKDLGVTEHESWQSLRSVDGSVGRSRLTGRARSSFASSGSTISMRRPNIYSWLQVANTT